MRITESDIRRIIKNVVNENGGYVTGLAPSERTELVDDVINRINEHGMRYIDALKDINSEFPVEKYKRPERIKRKDFELPKGVRVQSSYFSED